MATPRYPTPPAWASRSTSIVWRNSFRNDLAARPGLAVERHSLWHEGKHPTIYRQCHSANECRRR